MYNPLETYSKVNEGRAGGLARIGYVIATPIVVRLPSNR
jgi:hypothetical protein